MRAEGEENLQMKKNNSQDWRVSNSRQINLIGVTGKYVPGNDVTRLIFDRDWKAINNKPRNSH